MKFQTAALLIPNNKFLIGDLSIGYNIEIVARKLKLIGYELKKISVINEITQAAADELTQFSKFYDIILILSNAQPDCLCYALANITSHEVSSHMEPSNFSCKLDQEKYLLWPKPIKFLKTKTHIKPVIYFQRMFILTIGVVEEQFNFILEDHLRQYQKDNIYSKLFSIPSNGVKNSLNCFQNDNVTITFEKHTENGSEKTFLKVSSNNFENIVNKELLLRQKLGLKITNSSWVNTASDMVYECSDKHIKFTIQVIEKCLKEYGLENVFLSFNGGKDCTVLLHLVQTVIEKMYPNQRNKTKLYCLYVRSDNAFKEQDEFIEQCGTFFNLKIVTITSNIKEALKLTLEQNPQFKACFMGTRRTDPYSSNLSKFEMTDPDWPQIMRCNPILDWFYSDIWDYLLYYKVPYCKLYDLGYTSLGNTRNTIRNPNLLFSSDGEREVYLPAYKLLNEKKERIGRNISKI